MGTMDGKGCSQLFCVRLVMDVCINDDTHALSLVLRYTKL